MFIGGFQKFTMLDYPGKIAAVVFTSGCNFRCPFCHNPELVDPKLTNYKSEISEKEILKFLKSRKKELDGICITGGEPTLQSGLKKFIENIKKMGFLVKVDTNGSYFNVVSDLVKNNLVDYWAIDIKTIPKKYKIMSKKNDVLESIEKSINVITNSNKNFELRTTVVPGYINLEDFDNIIKWINTINKNTFSKLYRYSIQNFKSGKTLHSDLKVVKPYTRDVLEKMAQKMKRHCKNIVISE